MRDRETKQERERDSERANESEIKRGREMTW